MASRLQPITDNASLLVRADFQASGQPLPTTERFGVGGPTMAPGFPPGDITGDSGFNIRVELRYGHDTVMGWLKGFQLYGYYTYGFVSDQTLGPGDWNSLSSLGLGMRLNLFASFALNPEVSHQLSGHTSDCINCNNETRVLFSVTKRF